MSFVLPVLIALYSAVGLAAPRAEFEDVASMTYLRTNKPVSGQSCGETTERRSIPGCRLDVGTVASHAILFNQGQLSVRALKLIEQTCPELSQAGVGRMEMTFREGVDDYFWVATDGLRVATFRRSYGTETYAILLPKLSSLKSLSIASSPERTEDLMRAIGSILFCRN